MSSADRPGLVAGRPRVWWEWLIWLVAAELLITRVFQFGDASNRWVVTWQALLPWQFAVGIPALVLAASTRRWRGLVVVALGWLSLLPLVLAWQFHGEQVEPGEDRTLSVATANVLFDNDHLGAALADAAATDADVIVLSELIGRRSDELRASGLIDDYPYHSVDPYGIGIVVVSRYPIDIDGPSSWTSGESQAMVLDVEGTNIRLIASHPPPPVFGIDIWNAELSAIGNDVASLAMPSIVAGDLNAGWGLPPFREMLDRGQMTDAMAAAGHPWTMTWPAESLPRFPFVTLDHILVTRELGVVDADSFEVTGSDHKGIVATLAIEV